MKLQQKKNTRQFYPNPVTFNEKEISILKLIAQDKTTEEISKEEVSKYNLEIEKQKELEKLVDELN
mgnify:CR=1 FL=1